MLKALQMHYMRRKVIEEHRFKFISWKGKAFAAVSTTF